MPQNLSGMRNIILFLLIAVPLLVLINLSLQTKNTPTETLRIGINQWPGYEFLYVAKKEGFFKAAGLNIELIELGSLAETRRAFERKKIDGMAVTLVEILEAYKYSERIAQITLVLDYSNGADVILGSPEVKFIRDLKGKKIGVETGSLSLYLVNRALQLNSIKLSEVELVPMKFHEMESSLITGKIDAITTYPPSSVAIKKRNRVNLLFDSSEIPGEIIDVVAIDKDILTRLPELHTKLQQVWAHTLEYVKTNPEEAYNTLIERFDITLNEIKESMKEIYLVSSDEQMEFLKPNGIAQQSINKIGNIVFMNSDNDIDYSQFIYNIN